MGAVVLAIALALLFAVPAPAQTNATFQGRVFDGSGARQIQLAVKVAF